MYWLFRLICCDLWIPWSECYLASDLYILWRSLDLVRMICCTVLSLRDFYRQFHPSNGCLQCRIWQGDEAYLVFLWETLRVLVEKGTWKLRILSCSFIMWKPSNKFNKTPINNQNYQQNPGMGHAVFYVNGQSC